MYTVSIVVNPFQSCCCWTSRPGTWTPSTPTLSSPYSPTTPRSTTGTTYIRTPGNIFLQLMVPSNRFIEITCPIINTHRHLVSIARFVRYIYYCKLDQNCFRGYMVSLGPSLSYHKQNFKITDICI